MQAVPTPGHNERIRDRIRMFCISPASLVPTGEFSTISLGWLPGVGIWAGKDRGPHPLMPGRLLISPGPGYGKLSYVGRCVVPRCPGGPRIRSRLGNLFPKGQSKRRPVALVSMCRKSVPCELVAVPVAVAYSTSSNSSKVQHSRQTNEKPA